MTPPDALRILVVGTGRVASSLARALQRPPRAGEDEVDLLGILGRDPERTRSAARACGVPAAGEADLSAADLLVLAVSDTALPDVASDLARRLAVGGARPRWTVHCSGATPVQALTPMTVWGAAVGAWHPLQSFPDPTTPPAPGTTWTITTDDETLRAVLTRLTDRLGGRPHALAEADRPAYHAAAVLASNLPAALVTLAVDVLTGCGFTPDDALAALLPLTRSALDGLAAHGPVAGLTGPVVRGDATTVAAHLAALDPATRAVYTAASAPLLDAAAARGVDPARLTDLRALLAPGPSTEGRCGEDAPVTYHRPGRR